MRPTSFFRKIRHTYSARTASAHTFFQKIHGSGAEDVLTSKLFSRNSKKLQKLKRKNFPEISQLAIFSRKSQKKNSKNKIYFFLQSVQQKKILFIRSWGNQTEGGVNVCHKFSAPMANEVSDLFSKPDPKSSFPFKKRVEKSLTGGTRPKGGTRPRRRRGDFPPKGESGRGGANSPRPLGVKQNVYVIRIRIRSIRGAMDSARRGDGELLCDGRRVVASCRGRKRLEGKKRG